MWIWIVVAVVVVAGVYAFWPRAGSLGARVNRASILAHARVDDYGGTSGAGDVGGGGDAS